jgi:hypothetical protein
MRTSKISGNFRELTLELKSPLLVVGRIPWSRRKGTKGLAISFAVPAFAQDKDTVDPEVRQQIEAIYMTNFDAHNKHEAAAVAALYTEDAVQVSAWESEGGLATGQQAIEKRCTA